VKNASNVLILSPGQFSGPQTLPSAHQGQAELTRVLDVAAP
jgi:hypothetical protein